jgi:hypothetical protein
VALVIHSWTNDGKIRAIGRLPKNGRKCRSGVGAPGGDVVGSGSSSLTTAAAACGSRAPIITSTPVATA